MSELLWLDKYRPQNFESIISQKKTVKIIEGAVKDNKIPHFIFYGPPGTGKTSMVHIIIKELFKDILNENLSDRILELNSSDDRGISTVRMKIKEFAKKTIHIDKSKTKLKIIILDEADSLTKDSQFALRRIIEDYSLTTRFCLICNYINKIIDPLISRCALVEFNKLKTDDCLNLLLKICENEKLNIEEEDIKKIILTNNNDLRKCINTLQNCFHNIESLDQEIINENKLIDFVINQTIIEKDINNFYKNIENLIFNSIQIDMIIKRFQYFILNSSYTNEKKKKMYFIFV